MSYLAMKDVDLQSKRLLMREDFNVPVKEGIIQNDARLKAALPSIQMALDKGAAVILMSHLGRPTAGEYDEAFSLAPVADYLSKALGQEVRLIKEGWADVQCEAGQVVLMENVRFATGEKKADEGLCRQMAASCDVFAMDAFGTAHRAEASTAGVAKYAKIACAGPLLDAELKALAKATAAPEQPVLAIVGGAKVSTKLTVLKSLADKVDYLLVGGGIANTFIAAEGHSVGKSLYEVDLVDEAKAIMQQVKVITLEDVLVAKEFDAKAQATVRTVDQILEDEMVLDIGPKTAEKMAQLIQDVKTIIWNGPLGVFEFDHFKQGTQVIAEAIARSDAFSLAGGGETLLAIDTFEIGQDVSYISTGGGAFLEFLEGKKLPAVKALEEANS